MDVDPPPPTDPPAAPPRRLRDAVRRLAPLITASLLLAMAAGAVGRLTRDRNLLLALMMYVPLLPVGLAAVAFDLVRRGRSLRRARFGLAALGLGAAIWGTVPLLGLRKPDPAPAGSTEIRLLHWNVMSGGRRAALPRWEAVAGRILSRHPDLIVLSEAPPDGWTFRTFHDHGERGWRSVHIRQFDDNSPYWYKPVVFSRSPLRHKRVTLRNGAAMEVTTEVKDRTVRLLVVDGLSRPTILRAPLLADVAAACEDAARRGKPYDVVVGDFNAVSASIGFEQVTAAGPGYRFAAEYCGGWRGTWPFPLPVYDIDHALVQSGVPVTGVELFSSAGFDTDHRGQLVRLALPADRR